jgi:hypothetical protein
MDLFPELTNKIAQRVSWICAAETVLEIDCRHGASYDVTLARS